MKTVLLSTLMVAAAAGAANAAIFNEVEGNNTMGTANNLGTYNAPGEGILIDGSITPGTLHSPNGAPGLPGDVDWFMFTVTGNTQMVASIFALVNSNAGGAAPDSQLMVVNATGGILAFDEDSNTGFMSSIDTLLLNPGTYWIAVSGFNDMNNGLNLPDGFQGNALLDGTTQNWTYKLIIGLNVAPTPGAAAMMGLGALVATRRRR
jgi:hypothetical protein